MTILDRYIVRSLIVNYLIGLGVMVSLYVVLDMFVNMDEFTETGQPIAAVAANIVDYYVPNIFLYFAQLSGVITAFACLATIARLRAQNELTAILSSGVSLHRVAAPVMGFALVTTVLLVIDTEFIIPAYGHKIARDRDDVGGARQHEILFLADGDDRLLSAARFSPDTGNLYQMLVLVRDKEGAVIETIEADMAEWQPGDEFGSPGRWKLTRGRKITRVTRPAGSLRSTESMEIELIADFPSSLSPDQITLRRSEGWIDLLSLKQLRRLEDQRVKDLPRVVQAKHSRVTAPLMSLVLVLLGLPFFLDRTPVSLLGDTWKCLMVCGLCYVTVFVLQGLRTESLSPLPAWLPILLFGPIAVVLIDRIKT